MNDIKKLAGQTLVYGLGTIVPRFLHYFVLTFFYTRVFTSGEYGVVTELYAYMVLFLVILTYGMETGFFRFAQDSSDPDTVFSTAFVSLIFTSLVFAGAAIIFVHPFARLLRYEQNPEYIRMFVLILAFDAVTAIPFARLRKDNRPLRFSLIKISNVIVTILLVLFFLKIAPEIVNRGGHLPAWLYNPEFGVGYVFLCNLMASGFVFLLLLPEITKVKFTFSYKLWKQMVGYSFPLLLGGLAGTINDALDKMILRRVSGSEHGLEIVGVYGASYKVAVLMSLFIQMFRFAVEPFFFEKSGQKDARETYAAIMKYFVIITVVIYLGLNLYISVIQYFIGSHMREALSIVPVVSLGYLLYGIFVNLSVWYKVNDMTRFGAYLTIGGSLITIAINLIFIPLYGYIASAWAHVACYGAMVIGSYLFGLKHYRIPYEIGKIAAYLFSGILIVVIVRRIEYANLLVELLVNTTIIALFVIVAQRRDKLLLSLTGKNFLNK
ncbi:MAG: oligosaccharide flippase family protein [Bacteroidales bacterium]